MDPQRQVGVFPPEVVSALPAVRAAEMEKFRWLCGEWKYENRVPATRFNPAYTDVGSCRFSLCDKDSWTCVEPSGAELRNITFDPFSRQWIYLLTRGSYGLLRSPEGWMDDRIVFSANMTMIGIAGWEYIDEWHFTRNPARARSDTTHSGARFSVLPWASAHGISSDGLSLYRLTAPPLLVTPLME